MGIDTAYTKFVKYKNSGVDMCGVWRPQFESTPLKTTRFFFTLNTLLQEDTALYRIINKNCLRYLKPQALPRNILSSISVSQKELCIYHNAFTHFPQKAAATSGAL
jgi:hypothetical protein